MIETSCPEARRVSTRRNKLKKLWTSKAWKEAVKEFVGDRPCEWCGSMERRTAHHPFRSTYGQALYMDLQLAGALVLCARCHMALHRGLKLCPVCKKHYAPFEREICFHCYCEKFPEVMEKVKQGKEEQKERRRKYNRERYQKAKKWKIDHPLPKKNGKNGGKA